MKAAIVAINIYRVFVSVLMKQALGSPHFCRYSPTCSQYAIESITKHGVLGGGYMSIKRVLSCRPCLKND